MAITKSSLVVSKASKPKNHKWDARARFSLGHDSTSMALISDPDLKMPRYKRSEVSVYRAPSFKMTMEERVYADADLLLKSGKVDTIEEAYELAVQALEAMTERSTRMLGTRCANLPTFIRGKLPRKVEK